MDQRYQDWITDLGSNLFGRCRGVTKEMVEAFPELRRVRGHYHCPIWGKRAHWWCVAPDGSIVDPTVSQFPSRGIGEYVLLDETAPIPTGKCPDCGEYVYGTTFCNDSCERRTAEYLRSSAGMI